MIEHSETSIRLFDDRLDCTTLSRSPGKGGGGGGAKPKDPKYKV